MEVPPAPTPWRRGWDARPRGWPQINHPETGSPYSQAMDHAEQLRNDLTFIDRMIAESQLHITRLKTIIAEMSRDAQDTNLAHDVLASYAAALTRHEAQRRLIVSMMDKDLPDQPDQAKAASAKPRSPGQPRGQGGRRARSPRRAARR